MPHILEMEQVDQLARKLRIERHPIRRLRTRFFKQHWSAFDSLREIPVEVRDRFQQQLQFSSLTLDAQHNSQQDGASKLIFKTEDGYRIESVILRMRTGRTSLCVSSQVGCAANCDFCATGKMGIAKNLSHQQILDQVIQANQILHKEQSHVRNLVFMGMGEPLHNEEELSHSIERLIDPYCFDHSPRRILVSTVGIPEVMLNFAQRFPAVNLALSLHSAVQETRESIIPLAKKYSLDQLRSTLQEIGKFAKQPIMLEYLMLRGINDTEAENQELHQFASGLNVHINLIPFNMIEDAPHLQGAEKPQREWFANRLKAQGHTVTLRYSLGADIAAACGQLVRNENRHIAIEQKTLVSL